MTPRELARALIGDLELFPTCKILEPSFGQGSFLFPLIEQMMHVHGGASGQNFERVMLDNVYGVEVDPHLYNQTIAAIEFRWGPLPEGHHLELGDYFRFVSELMFSGFDYVVGNPPFGGTFDAALEDALDRKFGSYRGHKLKKETYSFFVAKGIEELAQGGHLRFICSDTFLTIKTMRGLRELLLDSGAVRVHDVPGSFDETGQPMIILDLKQGPPADYASIRECKVSRRSMEQTQNLSWGVREEHGIYFNGPTLGDYVVASGGMTIGKNEWFVRPIEPDGSILEPYQFEFFERPITLEGEIARARLHRLSGALRDRAIAQERRGDTRRAVRAVRRLKPIRFPPPHADYRPYNKATSRRLYADLSHVIYWRDQGDAVMTFKRDGPWYLHGVGGQPFFGREGLTWQLVAAKINARYLPSGFILDSGAPCAFLRADVPRDRLFVILGWLQTDLATYLMKTVINHTRNIQGKDVERLPFPHWVSEVRLKEIGTLVERTVTQAMAGRQIDQEFSKRLESLFDLQAAELAA